VLGIDRELHLNHAGLVVLIDLADGFIVFKDEPTVLGVRVREVLDQTLPVADRSATVHEVYKDVLHLVDCGVGRFEDGLLPALTPAVVAALELLGVFSQKFKVADLDHNFVLLTIGWQADTHADLTDHLVLVGLEKAKGDSLLLDGLF